MATLSIITPPANSENYAAAAGEIRYHAMSGYVGLDQLTYRICDTGGGCATAILYLNGLGVVSKSHQGRRPWSSRSGATRSWRKEWTSSSSCSTISSYRYANAFGFRLESSWRLDETHEFMWIVSHDGAEGFEAADAAYYSSPDRDAVNPNPLDFIEEVNTSMATRTSHPEGAGMNKMPEAMEHYWAMWNEFDLELVRGHLDQAVSEDFLFADPINFHQGRDALEANVREFRAERPTAGFTIASRSWTHTTTATGTSGAWSRTTR